MNKGETSMNKLLILAIVMMAFSAQAQIFKKKKEVSNLDSRALSYSCDNEEETCIVHEPMLKKHNDAQSTGKSVAYEYAPFEGNSLKGICKFFGYSDVVDYKTAELKIKTDFYGNAYYYASMVDENGNNYLSKIKHTNSDEVVSRVTCKK